MSVEYAKIPPIQQVSEVRQIIKEVSSADILDFPSPTVLLIADPGSGWAIQVLDIHYYYHHLTAYTTAPVIRVTGTGLATTSEWEIYYGPNWTQDENREAKRNGSTLEFPNQSQSLYLVTDSTPSGGTSTLTVYVRYRYIQDVWRGQ